MVWVIKWSGSSNGLGRQMVWVVKWSGSSKKCLDRLMFGGSANFSAVHQNENEKYNQFVTDNKGAQDTNFDFRDYKC